MATFQYFLLVLCSIGFSEGTATSRHRRVVNGVQEGSLVNGTVQNSGSFAFIVYITSEQHYIARDKVTNEWAWFSSFGQCGGAIIRDDVVITAAHCIKKAKMDSVRVHAGIVHKDEHQKSKQVGAARSLIWHEDHDAGWKFDLGLIFLDKKFNLSDRVKLINLPKAEDYANVFIATTAGWGRDESGTATDWLKSVEFLVTDNIVCQLHTQHVLTKSEICVMGKMSNATICKGDSGGPLFNQNVLLGVASNVIGDQNPNGSCKPNLPAVFVKVSNYIDWINECLEANGMEMAVFRQIQLVRNFFNNTRKETHTASNWKSL